jgi:hypothetical protein
LALFGPAPLITPRAAHMLERPTPEQARLSRTALEACEKEMRVQFILAMRRWVRGGEWTSYAYTIYSGAPAWRDAPVLANPRAAHFELQYDWVEQRKGDGARHAFNNFYFPPGCELLTAGGDPLLAECQRLAAPRPGEEDETKRYCMARCGHTDARGLMLSCTRMSYGGSVIGYNVVTGPFCGAPACLATLERRAKEATKDNGLGGGRCGPLFGGVVRRGTPTSVCAKCSRISTTRCSACKAVFYCSPECQRVHWREIHRAECSAERATQP